MKEILQKAENISLFLWLLLIPTQLGKHFWPEFASVAGIRVDYLSPTLYLLDLIWIIWIGSRLITNFKLRITNWEKIINFENLIILIFIALNILVAVNKGVAIYRWVRILQWVVTLEIIRKEGRPQGSPIQKMLVWILPWWIGGETLLGLAQLVKGGSLQGVWYWLGERRFSLTTVGVAQISWLGQGWVRAYGTFSHPNSMSGFLLVAWILWSRYRKLVTNRTWWWVVTWLAVMGIMISGSRTVWALLVVMFTVFNLKFLNSKRAEIKKVLGYGAIMIGVFMIIVAIMGINYRTSDFVGGWDSDSLAKRVSLNIAAIKMWREHFMLGIGAGNFIAELPNYQGENQFYWLQPVHNIFLLTGVELGMLGIILLIKLIITNYELRINKKNWVILGIIAVTGMVDHYWLTLPQNFWLLAVVLGVI